MLEAPLLYQLLLFALKTEMVPPLEVVAAAACKGKVVVWHYGGEILVPSGFSVGGGFMDLRGAQGVVLGLQL